MTTNSSAEYSLWKADGGLNQPLNQIPAIKIECVTKQKVTNEKLIDMESI